MSFLEKIQSNKRVFMVDENKETNLTLYSYNKCDNSDDDLIKKARGLIFCHEKLVCFNYPFTDDYCLDEKGKLMHKEKPLVETSTKYFEYLDGTLLRLYYFGEEWLLSTNRKLSAHDSRWGTRKSFGELFENVLSKIYNISFEDFTKTLNPKEQYMFLLVHQDNYDLYHIGTMVGAEHKQNKTTMIKKPKELSFNTFDDVTKYILENQTKVNGIIACNNDGSQWKLTHSHYSRKKKILENNPNIMFRYLELRKNNDLDDFMHYFAEKYKYEINVIETTIEQLTIDILSAYIRRFIKKMYTRVEQNEYPILYNCHKHYIETHERINEDIVRQEIHKLDVKLLYKIIMNRINF